MQPQVGPRNRSPAATVAMLLASPERVSCVCFAHVCCGRRFCEEQRQRLAWLREEGGSFSAWWRSLGAEQRKQLTTDKGAPILKGLVKQFFNEKEVTSTLVMDALFCGCRQLEAAGRNKVRWPAGHWPASVRWRGGGGGSHCSSGSVPRSRTPCGMQQAVWAAATCSQDLRCRRRRRHHHQ